MDKLLMHIGLIDQVTKPLRGISKQMHSTMDAGRQGMSNMVSGGAGLVATGFAIQNALMPAIEMDRKIGEVASLGVTDDALKQLEKTALNFSVKYGKSATDFVAASYDIQSAIAGLDGNELSQFTKASGVLAAATKADTGTITNYMGTMYGIFKNQANEMGKGEWVEQVTGMTASAVQMFKTTGSEMSAAFTSVGADATSVGVGMNEQMAILGTLQATMSGSEAGTKYRAFLSGVAKAQDKLNMSFTNSHGQLLPMVDILEQLKGRYGETIDVAESAELAKAFGTKEASGMIKLLMADTHGLAQSVEQLGNIQGMNKAEEMAAKMTDQWERLEAVWFAVRASVFGAILPALNSVVGTMVDGLSVIVGWVDEFPLLGEILGWVGVAILSLTGVIGALALASGLATIVMTGLGVAFAVLTSPITLVVGVIAAAVTAIWYYWDYISAFVSGFIGAFIEASGISGLFQPLVNIFKVISHVVSLAFDWIVQLLQPMQATGEALEGLTSAGQLFGYILGAAFGAVITPIKMVLKAIDWLLDKLNMIPGIDIDVSADMPDTPELEVAKQSVQVTPELEQMGQTVSIDEANEKALTNVASITPDLEMLTQTKTNVVEFPTEVPAVNKITEMNDASIESDLISYKQPQNQTKLPQSMVQNAITTNNKEQSGNNRTYGNITINAHKPFTPDDLAQWEELNVG